MESTAEPIYFYKAHDPYGCFSNFSLHPIHCEALDWPTVEHFYQAHKFLLPTNKISSTKFALPRPQKLPPP